MDKRKCIPIRNVALKYKSDQTEATERTPTKTEAQKNVTMNIPIIVEAAQSDHSENQTSYILVNQT